MAAAGATRRVQVAADPALRSIKLKACITPTPRLRFLLSFVCGFSELRLVKVLLIGTGRRESSGRAAAAGSQAVSPGSSNHSVQ